MTYTFDGTFDGLLCVVAAARERGVVPAAVERAGAAQGGLFDAPEHVATDGRRAQWTEQALGEAGDASAARMLYRVLLSEAPGAARIAVHVALALLDRGPTVFDDLDFEAGQAALALSRRVSREVHRMHAFVRFEAAEVALADTAPEGEAPGSRGGSYVAVVEPDCDVLPLVGAHFARRFPAMRWAILDARRRYGLVYDGARLRIADALPDALWQAAPKPGVVSEAQRLWQTYFRAVNIPERRNPKLHRQHLPKRYWRYLPEKWTGGQDS